MAVVQVGHVVVRVRHLLMRMHMRVFPGDAARVPVQVVTVIMRVCMVVDNLLMDMRMLMLVIHQEPSPQHHQRQGCQEQPAQIGRAHV